jgi:hypothetical protein
MHRFCHVINIKEVDLWKTFRVSERFFPEPYYYFYKMMYEKRELRSIAIISVVIFLIICLYFFVYPLYHPYFPKCIFNKLTGVYCPLCGTQRAVSALLHGNILIAMRNNLLAVLTILLSVFLFILSLINILKREHLYNKIFYSQTFLKAAGLVVVIFGILRNMPIYPFGLLAPL